LRAGQRDGYDAFGKDLLDRFRGDRGEMRDIDDSRDCRHCERTRRIYVATAVMWTGVIRMATRGCVVRTLNDGSLVRAEGQLQAIGLRRCQHETDRQKCTGHQ